MTCCLGLDEVNNRTGWRGIREIALDDLVVSKGQVRLRDVGKDIDELAAGIRKLGLPVVRSPL